MPTHKYLEGDAITIRCAHGDVTLYPLADVDLEVDGLPIRGQALAVLAIRIQSGATSLDQIFTLCAVVRECCSGTPGHDM